MYKIFLFLAFVLLTGCQPNNIDVGPVEGLKPVYISEEDNVVEVQDIRGFENLGKIVYTDPYLLINERFQGIHIVDNTDPSDPIKVAFLQIPGNTDFTLKGAYLYANHGNDLKTFLITNSALNLGFDLVNLEETQIIDSFFSEEDNVNAGLFPPAYEGFFECVDESKGMVIGWDTAILTNPECRI